METSFYSQNTQRFYPFDEELVEANRSNYIEKYGECGLDLLRRGIVDLGIVVVEGQSKSTAPIISKFSVDRVVNDNFEVVVTVTDEELTYALYFYCNLNEIADFKTIKAEECEGLYGFLTIGHVEQWAKFNGIIKDIPVFRDCIKWLNKRLIAEIEVINNDRWAPFDECYPEKEPRPGRWNYGAITEGNLVLKAGYNCELIFDETTNGVRIAPVVGAGMGIVSQAVGLGYDENGNFEPIIEYTNRYDLIDGDITYATSFANAWGEQISLTYDNSFNHQVVQVDPIDPDSQCYKDILVINYQCFQEDCFGTTTATVLPCETSECAMELSPNALYCPVCPPGTVFVYHTIDPNSVPANTKPTLYYDGYKIADENIIRIDNRIGIITENVCGEHWLELRLDDLEPPNNTCTAFNTNCVIEINEAYYSQGDIYVDFNITAYWPNQYTNSAFVEINKVNTTTESVSEFRDIRTSCKSIAFGGKINMLRAYGQTSCTSIFEILEQGRIAPFLQFELNYEVDTELLTIVLNTDGCRNISKVVKIAFNEDVIPAVATTCQMIMATGSNSTVGAFELMMPLLAGQRYNPLIPVYLNTIQEQSNDVITNTGDCTEPSASADVTITALNPVLKTINNIQYVVGLRVKADYTAKADCGTCNNNITIDPYFIGTYELVLGDTVYDLVLNYNGQLAMCSNTSNLIRKQGYMSAIINRCNMLMPLVN